MEERGNREKKIEKSLEKGTEEAIPVLSLVSPDDSDRVERK